MCKYKGTFSGILSFFSPINTKLQNKKNLSEYIFYEILHLSDFRTQALEIKFMFFPPQLQMKLVIFKA